MTSAGTYDTNTSFPLADPIIKRIDTDDGPMWEVSGLGMVTMHKQLWQAELIWVCMCTSKGILPKQDQ